MRRFASLSLALLGGTLVAAAAIAQTPPSVVRDGSIGPSADVQPVGPAYRITPGMGEARGENLFHSFRDFGLRQGGPAGPESAHFEGAAGIDHILARVTGGRVSEIDGRLGADASLWLLNPSGIVFGPGASLDVAGSFHATTADRVVFADGGGLDAGSANPPVLSAAAPAEFGFLPQNTARVAVEGASLAVAGGATLELRGAGEVALSGSVAAPGSDAAPAGEVRIEGAAIALAAQSRVHADGALGGGRVVLRGGSLQLGEGAAISADALGGSAAPPRNGGSVAVQVGSLALAPSARITADARGAVGSGGEVRVTGSDLRVQGEIGATAFGSGVPGLVEVDPVRREGRVVAANGELVAQGVDARGRFAHFRIGPGAHEATAENRLYRLRELRLAAGETLAFDASSAPLLRLFAVVEGPDGASLGGRLRSTTPGADFVLLAPDGVIFGPRADLDVARSFLASTAERALLAGGGFVGAGAPPGALSGGAPTSLVFEAGPPAAIEVQGALLEVPTRRQLSLVGGRVDVSGDPGLPLQDPVTREILAHLQARQGRVLAAAVEEGDLLLAADGRASAAPGARLGAVTLQGARISVTEPVERRRGGTLQILAGQVSLAGGAALFASGFAGGEVDVAASGPVSIVDSRVEVSGNNAGRLALRGNGILLRDSFLLGESFVGESLGIEAEVVVDAGAGDLVLEGSDVIASTFGGRRGGDIALRGGRLLMRPSARRNSVVEASPRSATFGQLGRGAAGSISVAVGSLEMRDGSQIVSLSDSSEPAGDVRIQVSGSAVLSGVRGNAPTGVGAQTFGPGRGGSIELRAASLEISAGAEVSVESVASEGDPRLGGRPPGDAGDVRLLAGDRLVIDGGRVSTRARGANGGNVTVQARRLVRLRGGAIDANVGGGVGGNIDIDPVSVVLQRGSRVVAQAGAGFGGAIRIVTDAFVPEDGTLIDASAGDPSRSGSVTIYAPDVNLSGNLTPLPDAPLDVTAFLRERCASRSSGEPRGSFVVSGRGGAPPAPDALLAAGAAPSAAAERTVGEFGAGGSGPLLLAAGCE